MNPMTADARPPTADAFERATELVDEGKFRQAVEEFNRILQSDPQNAVAFQGLGYSLMHLGQWDRAIIALRKSSELNPKLILSHAHLGYCLDRRQQYQDAERELRLALALDPSLVETTVNLGCVLFKQRRLGEAEAMFKHALELTQERSKQSWILDNLARLYAHQRRFDDSFRTVLQAYRLAPSFRTGMDLVRVFPRKWIVGTLRRLSSRRTVV